MKTGDAEELHQFFSPMGGALHVGKGHGSPRTRTEQYLSSIFTWASWPDCDLEMSHQELESQGLQHGSIVCPSNGTTLEKDFPSFTNNHGNTCGAVFQGSQGNHG